MQVYSTSNSLRRQFSLLLLPLFLVLLVPSTMKAQDHLMLDELLEPEETALPDKYRMPSDSVGPVRKYSAMIELPKAYLSGVCVLRTENDTVTGCLFNEFGISALEFVRYPGKKKAKILSVIEMLDKWYIKRVLSRDIARLLDNLKLGKGEYYDERYKINYKFTSLNDNNATEE